MTENSTRLNLPYIQPAQAQKHVTHNEAIELLDAIVNLSLVSIDSETPPTSPNEGEAWSLGDNPTGAWAGQSNHIASFRNGGWIFINPSDGWVCWDVATSANYVRTNSAWQKIIPEAFENLSGLGVNATSDPVNPLSVAGDASLFSHGGSDHRLKINKATQTDTANVLFQSAFSGRAEIGIIGNDEFELRVSDDGVTWNSALRTANVGKQLMLSEVLNLAPSAEPVTPIAGAIYFDSTTTKLRCFDGSIWQDLF